MAQKKNYSFVCQECGYQAYQWLGKCPDCGQWNTFAEQSGAEARKSAERSSVLAKVDLEKVRKLSDIDGQSVVTVSTGYDELDRVLGGGIHFGSTVLIAGEPGIGKSTLLLKVGVTLAQQKNPGAEMRVLYISAEEAQERVKARAVRLGLSSDAFYIVSEADVLTLAGYLEKLKPTVVIVDSIQAVFNSDIPSAPGTITQVRECAIRFCNYAHQAGATVMMIGHVTKDGLLAGPKSLEHLVDTVVYFEGERYDDVRLVRAVKNRYGATGEIGIFEMKSEGLVPVSNPSRYFLSESAEPLPGRATVAMLEGRRPFLVEVQALVNQTSFNNPLRRSVGIEVNKISLLLAVLEKSLAINFSKYDLFIKSAGAITVNDPAADLAVCAAVLSSLRQDEVPQGIVCIGEVGLGGEVRKVKLLQQRVTEAERLGFTQVYIPKGSDVKCKTIKVREVGTIVEFYSALFAKK